VLAQVADQDRQTFDFFLHVHAYVLHGGGLMGIAALNPP
jgi:hypothetical protein